MVTPIPRWQVLQGWLPAGVYDRSLVMRALLEAEGAEFDAARAALAAVLDQWFVSSATWALHRWEAEVGLPTNRSLTLTERRSAVLARLVGSGTATPRLLRQVGAQYGNGELRVLEDFEAYTLAVRFVGEAGIPSTLPDVQAALREVAPAHLTLAYLFSVSIWSVLDEAALTFDDLDVLALDWNTFDASFAA